MKPLPDVLVAAASAGDEAAISRLLAVCQPDLKRFARRACSNAEDAEQKSLVKVIKGFLY